MITISHLKIGILALQGAFAKHETKINELGAATSLIRTPGDLQDCDALIIPGGESTTIFKQMNFIELKKPILQFAAKKPVFGTCAGLILMSKEIINSSLPEPLGLLDVSVERNSFGRQIESFNANLEICLQGKKLNTSALFIRAPRIRRCGPEVKILASYEGEPVLVQQGDFLGSTFHPELTSETCIHDYFLSLVKQSKSAQGREIDSLL